MTTIKERMGAALKTARDIAAKAEAEGREMTAGEVASANAALVDYKAAKVEYGKFTESQSLKEALAAIGDDRPAGGSGAGAKLTPGVKTGTVRGQKWADAAMAAVKTLRPDGAKAFLSGSVAVPNLLDGGRPVEIEARATTVLDLIPRGEPSGTREGNGFKYLRQTTRTNNAAAVADLAAKPTSIYTFGEVNDRYRVYANKTEDLPYRYLEDYQGLTDIVRQQLADDTLLAIEADVLAGTGSGEGFTGVLNTSGVQTQAWATDLLTTLSNAKYKLITAEIPITGWVMNPTDLQRLELLREGGSTGAFLFKSRAEIEDFVGATIVTATGITAGTTIGGDWDQTEIIPLGDDELVVDTGKRTTNNTFLLMFEGRYGFRVKKPASLVKATITGA